MSSPAVRPLPRSFLLTLLLAALPGAAIGCGDDAATDAGGSGGSASSSGDGPGSGSGGEDAEPATASAIGEGDASRVTFVDVYADEEGRLATDIDLHPTRDELWVLLREPYSGAPCTEDAHGGCFALQGSVAIVSGPASGAPTFEWKQDPNAWHFMRRPSGIAFGEADTFATIHEHRTGNFEDEDEDYIGPTLWSSDPTIFAIEPPGANGSHLDMLHETPFGMGIAHDNGNAYWTFNGQIGALDRYDFHEPHEIGGEDHRDGGMQRWIEGQLLRTPEVPSHLELDHASGWLYVADTGHGRVIRVDTLSGTQGAELDPLETMNGGAFTVDGAVVEDFVPVGVLAQPSGLAIAGEGDGAVIFVGDRATGTIVAFGADDGAEMARLATNLPGLAGLALGPDGSLYAVAHDEGRVVRLVVAP